MFGITVPISKVRELRPRNSGRPAQMPTAMSQGPRSPIERESKGRDSFYPTMLFPKSNINTIDGEQKKRKKERKKLKIIVTG